jgi:arylsulfatase
MGFWSKWLLAASPEAWRHVRVEAACLIALPPCDGGQRRKEGGNLVRGWAPRRKELTVAKKFQGKIAIDIRDSVPDWSPYVAPEAPKDAPNVLYIVWDDVGFGAFDLYGGMIEVPNMRRLAEAGVRYSQFHTTALCSPSRACFVTGRNATSNGMAGITEISDGFPGHNGHIPFENGLISEVLVERGYSTFALGKWHLTADDEANMGSSKRLWPVGRGFERYYGFIGAESDQWYPALIHDNHPVDPPYTPQQGYHLSKDLVDTAIRFIRDTKMIAPQRPWLMYFCPGAGHAPHHVWKDWSDRYKGKFDMGYEEYRRTVLANQKKLGIIPENTQLPPLNPYADARSPDGKPWPESDAVRPWNTLSADEKRLFTRMAEVYAGYISYTDDQIGRLLDYLEESKQLENTLVVVVSDNGASAEGSPNGSVNENKFFNGLPDTIEANMKLLGDLGTEKTYNHYPTGWAMAFNTPFKLFKRYAGSEGGTSDPMIVSWPKGIKARNEWRHQYLHAIDIVPTIYDCLGIEPPATVKGYPQSRIEGVSFKATFDDAQVPTPKETQFYAMLGTRGIWHQGWHASTVHPPTPSGWGHFAADRWEIFHLDEDRNQMKNLADQEPERLELMKNLWFLQAGLFKALPLDDRTAPEILNAPRPQPSPPRDHYVYYPDTAEVPSAAAVIVTGRSYNIVAEVTIDSPEAGGVLFAHGGRFGGHSLFIKDGKLNYVYNFVGDVEQKLTSDEDVPTGKALFGVRFRLESQEDGVPVGKAALYINDKLVAEAKIKTQPSKFSLAGEGLCIGRDSGTAVSSDYQAPFSFKGGTIKRVLVDVSGERYRDLEKTLTEILARD